MRKQKDISIHLCYLLRHHPEAAGLDMDRHGWVSTRQLIDGVNAGGKYTLTLPRLEAIVASDSKGRYRFNQDHSRIKACQGHSIDWVEPELTYLPPPEVLYHGTTMEAWDKIRETGYISKMARHAVHLQAEQSKARQSAERWHKQPAVLQIDAAAMARDGFTFGVSDNGVWCTERVPVKYITGVL